MHKFVHLEGNNVHLWFTLLSWLLIRRDLQFLERFLCEKSGLQILGWNFILSGLRFFDGTIDFMLENGFLRRNTFFKSDWIFGYSLRRAVVLILDIIAERFISDTAWLRCSKQVFYRILIFEREPQLLTSWIIDKHYSAWVIFLLVLQFQLGVELIFFLPALNALAPLIPSTKTHLH